MVSGTMKAAGRKLNMNVKALVAERNFRRVPVPAE
jgi:hypothetical protein